MKRKFIRVFEKNEIGIFEFDGLIKDRTTGKFWKIISEMFEEKNLILKCLYYKNGLMKQKKNIDSIEVSNEVENIDGEIIFEGKDFSINL